MKLKNNSKNAFIHMVGRTKIYLGQGDIIEVPNDVAKMWLKYDGVEEYTSPEEIKALKEQVAKKTTKKAKEEK